MGAAHRADAVAAGIAAVGSSWSSTLNGRTSKRMRSQGLGLLIDPARSTAALPGSVLRKPNSTVSPSIVGRVLRSPDAVNASSAISLGLLRLGSPVQSHVVDSRPCCRRGMLLRELGDLEVSAC